MSPRVSARGTTGGRRALDTRARILEAALDVFARKGYHRAIVDDIVGASRTSKGGVYHHFPNKEAVFLALVDDFTERLTAAVASAVAQRRGALAKVEGALTAVLATFADHERLARVVLLEAVSLGRTYQAKRAEVAARFTTLIQGYLDEAVADGSLAPIDTRVTTLAWLGAVNEIVIQWLHGTVADLSATVPSLTRVLLRSIGARGASPEAG